MIKKTIEKIFITGSILAGFAFVGNLSVISMERLTHEQIEINKRQALLDKLYQLIDKKQFDNDILEDKIEVSSDLLSSKQSVVIYRAFLKEKPSVAIIQSIAPDGYSGSIFLLVGIKTDGSLLGVRVTAHKETPGLGDDIDANKSDWILSFNNTSLSNPKLENWKVKKDGGQFDQFTGATISPRAIVKAVKKTLIYYQQNKAELFKRESNE